MRLRKSKTWSQQELETRLRLEPEKSGLLSWDRQRLLIHAGKTALAAGLCWWLAQRFGIHEGYWGAISAIIVLQSNVGATVSASRDRILGTLIGAALGFACTLFGTLPWNYIVAILGAVVLCGVLGLRESSRLAGVTVTIVMLVRAGSHWSIAMDRVIDVFLGILVALAVSWLIFPDRARIRLRDGLALEFLRLGALFEAILTGFRGAPDPKVAQLREEVLTAIRANNRLMEAARNEPSGGLGMREGLGLLSQFGRDLFDSLVALEIAVKDSNRDDFAQQLEPELGTLADHIHAAFPYVAGCVHNWRFDVPPHFQLEDDVAGLEARMAEVRHTGRNFPQAEILRAYAVQLHLKQIAQLLRASRVETNLAIGES